MDQASLFKIVTERLEKGGIPYMTTGGLAVSFWGFPRTTHDIDIIIEIEEADKNKLVDIFKKDFYVDQATIEEAISNRSSFNIIHYKTGIKVDLWVLKKDFRSTLEFKKRVRRKVFDKNIYIVSPEDLVLIKLLWYKKSQSDRHLEDVKSVLSISQSEIDMDYIKNWAERQSTLDILEDLIKKV